MDGKLPTWYPYRQHTTQKGSSMKTITENALLKRINRKLAHKGQQLRKTRPNSRWFHNLGEFYRIDLRDNRSEGTHLSLTNVALELGVLAENERVES